MLYERTALSKKPDELIRHELDALRETDRMTPDLVFKDPYILDFLGLRDTYYERDLEDAILREMEAFLLELGAGFAFLARQQRIQVDSDDFYLDLLFYNRRLRRLVALDFKLGDFSPATKARWSCTCAGWTSTNASRAKPRRWASSCAPARSGSRSSCWNWTRPASTSPNT